MTENGPDARRRQLLTAVGLLTGIGTSTTLVAGAGTDSTSGDGATATADGAPDGDGPSDGESGEATCPLDGPGLVTVESDRCFDATVAAIRDRIEQSPLSLLTTVDHAANADTVDRELPPTTLLVFGNPEVGTQLMQERRSVAIDLPQKLLVWEDGGTVRVTYNDPEYLADRHGIEGQAEVLETVATALRKLATGEAGDGEGTAESDS